MNIGISALLAENAQMGALEYVLAVIALLAGLGAFLFGFKVLSDNIEKLATRAKAASPEWASARALRRSFRVRRRRPSWSSGSST